MASLEIAKDFTSLKQDDRNDLFSLTIEGSLFHIFGPKNLIDCWHTVALYDGGIYLLLLLVVMRVAFMLNRFCNAAGRH